MRIPDAAAGSRKPRPEGVCTALSDLPDTALITPKALANALGRSESSVKRAIGRGELPPPVRMAVASRRMVGEPGVPRPERHWASPSPSQRVHSLSAGFGTMTGLTDAP